jgi:hypothetical protein
MKKWTSMSLNLINQNQVNKTFQKKVKNKINLKIKNKKAVQILFMNNKSKK